MRFVLLFLLTIFPGALSARDYYPPLDWNAPLDLLYTRGIVLDRGAKAWENQPGEGKSIKLPPFSLYPLTGNSGWRETTPPELFFQIMKDEITYWVSQTELAPLLYSRENFHLARGMAYKQFAKDPALGELWIETNRLIIIGGNKSTTFPLSGGDMTDFHTFNPKEARVENVNRDNKKEIILDGTRYRGRWKTEGAGGQYRLYITLESNTPRVLFEHWLTLKGLERESISTLNFKDLNEDGFRETIEVLSFTPETIRPVYEVENYPGDSIVEVNLFRYKEGHYLREGEGKPFIPVVGTNNLRVRVEPDLESEVIGRVNKWETPYLIGATHKEETIEGLTSCWYEILWYGDTPRGGWIFGGYINLFPLEDVEFRAPANFD